MAKFQYDKALAKKLAKQKPQGNSWQIYKRLLTYGQSYVGFFIIAILANILYSGIDSVFAYLLKPLLNKGFVQPDPHFLKIIPFVIVGLFLGRAAMNLLGTYTMGFVARSVVMSFRQQLFKHLMHMPCRFYDQSSSGQLLSMLVYNAAQVASACTDAVTIVVQNGAAVIGFFTVMLVVSWQLTMIFFCSAPLIAIIVKLSSKHLRKFSRQAQDTMANISHVAEEAIEGYKVVRTFGGEQYEMNKFNEVTKKNARFELRFSVFREIGTSSIQMIGVITLALMIYVATQHIGLQQLSAGGFTAVVAAMMGMLKPLKALTTVNASIQRGLAGAETIFFLLDKPAEQDTGTIQLTRAQGNIVYKDVSFAYDENAGDVLSHINFAVKPGQTVALVGRSGSGKSTLVSLLPRFYDISQGQISIDGINTLDISLSNLRQQFALVTQHVVLFNDTIAHNISYGVQDEAVSREQIIEAAKAAHAMEFIERLPNGIDTLIGENGVLLSGGQRQRLAIARAILKDAPILILDEATSALDTESERFIQAALVEVMKNRTTLVIAHRLSTIEKADVIIVLDHGRIVEQGTHTELLAKGQYYKKLYEMQFQDLPENNDTLTG